MTRTYVKGRKKFSRRGHKHSHCWICGYDPRLKGRKKTIQRNFIKFHILNYINGEICEN